MKVCYCQIVGSDNLDLEDFQQRKAYMLEIEDTKQRKTLLKSSNL